ncbi:MAG TPA: DedA family protein [Kofleriaceae bacterium]|nr:DedA family protein [Kofleriaceae bacterium]
MLDSVAHYVTHVIESMGYPGLFLLIVLESTLVPIPSELVMPFAGYLASRGTFSLPAILAVNAAGAVTGSLISYLVGAAGGRPLLERYGKYVMVRAEDLRKTDDYFARHGGWTIFIGRFIPVVRHLISLPAGVARMRLSVFTFQTALGATIWGGGLMVVGYEIGANWERFARVAKRLDLIVGVIVLVILAALVVRFWRKRRAQRPAVAEPTRSVSP